MFGVSDGVENSAQLASQMSGVFTVTGAYAFMVFNLLAAPCFAAIGAIRREMGGWKWTFIAITFQTSIAYIVALIINQVGSAIFLGTNVFPAIIITVAIILVIVWLCTISYSNNQMRNSIKVTA